MVGMTAGALVRLAVRLRAAERVTILTGAGVSAASGVPTFRGPEGLWRSFRPEELATPDAFRRDPRLVWEWYAWRREKVAGCQPNAAHEVIARWVHERNAIVITQNVDDLHVRARTRGLVRLHGSIWELSCAGAAVTRGAGVDRGCEASWRDERVPLPRLPPACPQCGGLARPAVVWFGEPLAPQDVAAATAACACDLFLTVGTSAVVYPAAGLVYEAARRGAFTVEINAEATPASASVDLAIHEPAEDVLPAIDRLIADGSG
jgi:NAD-dependent deacetylase